MALPAIAVGAVLLLARGAIVVYKVYKATKPLQKLAKPVGQQIAKGAKTGAKAIPKAAQKAGKTFSNTKKGCKQGCPKNKQSRAKAAKPGNAAKRAASKREKYLGKTPGKNRPTGKAVQDRMRAEGKLRENPITGKTEFQASNKKWYDIKDADMAHKQDAVKWWNEQGRQYGAKSREVREWMLDSKNYTLEHYSINRSMGARLPDRYLPPLK